MGAASAVERGQVMFLISRSSHARVWPLAIAAAIAVFQGSAAAVAVTRNVDAANAACDDAAGAPFCTIQAAINASTDGDRIEIAAGSYIETLIVDRNVTLAGAGISAVEGACDGQTNLLGAPAVSVQSGVVARLFDVTVKGGAASFGSGIANAGSLVVANVEVCENLAFNLGGGIYNTGILTLNHVQVYDNGPAGAESQGGGLYVGPGGVAIVMRSTFTNNRMNRGGGICVDAGGTLVLRRSTLAQNFADNSNPTAMTGQGGAIYNAGLAIIDQSEIGEGNAIIDSDGSGGGIDNAGGLVLLRSVIYRNAIDRETPTALGPAFGAGLHNSGIAAVVSSTVSGNIIHPALLGYGAGVSNTGTLSLSGVTITDNANGGAGLTGGAGLYPGAGVATIRNSIIAQQAVGNDCDSGVTTDGHNIDSDDTCDLVSVAAGGTDQPNVADPGLLDLGDNGGQTRSHNLADDSPAIDGGDPAGCLADLNAVGPANVPLRADQRSNVFVGASGIGGDPSGCDIGAVEFNLIANGMMEDDKDRDNVPDGWSGSNLADSDDLFCLPEQFYASHCSFRLRGDANLVKQLSHEVDRVGSSGDRYALVVFASGVGVTGAPQVRVQFDDFQTIGVEEEFLLPVTLGSYLYQPHNLAIVTTGSYTYDRVTVTIEAGTGGGLYIDDVSLVPET